VLSLYTKGGKIALGSAEMAVGVRTGQRTTLQALSKAGELGLEVLLSRSGKWVSRRLFGNLFVGPCRHSTAVCEELRKQFIRTNPDLDALGRGLKQAGEELFGWASHTFWDTAPNGGDGVSDGFGSPPGEGKKKKP
jgi:hypothetical protein